MSTNGYIPRHRAQTNVLHPVVDLAKATTENASNLGRSAAVAVVSSGLLVGAVMPAGAVEVANNTPLAANSTAVVAKSLNLSPISADVQSALEVAPVTEISEDAVWETEAAEIKVTVDPAVTRAAQERAAEEAAAQERAEAQERNRVAREERAAAAANRSTEREETVASKPVARKATGNVTGQDIVEIARQYQGVPYRSGGTTPAGFDCSGFTSYVYAQVGIKLDRSSGAQRHNGRVVTDPQPGDLIWTPGHVSIYTGNGKQLDAPRTGKSIKERGIWQNKSKIKYIRIIEN